MGIKKYVKKPLVIEAIKLTEDTVYEIVDWVGRENCKINLMPCAMGIKNLTIKTLEGDMIADMGDYVIKGVKGEFYPCKRDIFNMTYNEVDDCGKTEANGAPKSIKISEGGEQ